jgi:hypothetical protein
MIKLTLAASALLACWATPALAKPLKVFILAGQSNMQGLGSIRTFEHIGMSPDSAGMLKDMTDANGDPVVMDDVYITYLSGQPNGGVIEPVHMSGKLTAGFAAKPGRDGQPRIGPEYTFGIYMHKHLNEPFLIIKTAWGGRSLHRDFRPPSTMPKHLIGVDPETVDDKNLKNDILTDNSKIASYLA